MTTDDTVLMEELSWTEIADQLNSGHDTALLACGAIEQHGPHLPIGVDTYLGYALGEYIARELGDALVAPTLRPGCSDHHIDFPGTISIRRQTFVSLLEDYCASLVRTGFNHIFLFPSHGGNIDVMRTYVPKIARDHYEEANIYFLDFDMSGNLKYLEDEGVERERAGVHAGYAETARMLSDYGDLIDMEKAEEGMTEPEFYEEDRIPQSQLESFTHGVRKQVPNGILGDARGATAADGEELKARMGDAMAETIRKRRESELVSMELPDSVAHQYN